MNIATLVMAAGESRRFDGCKLLSKLDNKLLLQFALENSHSLRTRWLYCVTGAWHHEIITAMNKATLISTPTLYNSEWQQGLGNSLAFSINQLPSECDGVLILLGDQWAIPQHSLLHMLADFDHQHIICAYADNHRTVPALFPKHCFAELSNLTGDQGARLLLRSEQYPVKTIALPEAMKDIDTRECLRQAAECIDNL